MTEKENEEVNRDIAENIRIWAGIHEATKDQKPLPEPTGVVEDD